MIKLILTLSIFATMNASASVSVVTRDGDNGISIDGQTAMNVYKAFKIKNMEYSSHTMGSFYEAKQIQCREVKSCEDNVPSENYYCQVSGRQNSYSTEEAKPAKSQSSSSKSVQFEFSGVDAKVIFDSLVGYNYDSKFNKETRELTTTTTAGQTFAEENREEDTEEMNSSTTDFSELSVSYDLFLSVDTESRVKGIPMGYPCGSRSW